MNNRGQVLVTFILFLPILFLLVGALVEIGDLLVYQSKLENNAKYIANYGIKHIDDLNIKSKLENLNQMNLNGKAKISVNNNYVLVEIKEKKENVFSFIKIPLTVEFKYRGVNENGKIKLKKE